MTTCRIVKEEHVKKVPVKVCRMVKEEHVKMIPYCVTKKVPYEVTRKVVKHVKKQVEYEVVRCVPRIVCVKVPCKHRCHPEKHQCCDGEPVFGAPPVEEGPPPAPPVSDDSEAIESALIQDESEKVL